MATKRKAGGARRNAASYVQQLLANPEVVRRLMEGGQEFLSKISDRWTERRKQSESGGRFANPFGAERLQRRLANTRATIDDLATVLGPTTPPGLRELQDQIARLTLSLKAAEGFSTVRRFRKLRTIDARLDDLENALFSLTLAGSERPKKP
jgi:hypothetical protein